MAQLNLRVPEEVKHRVRILATRDRREMSDIVIEAIKLYEAAIWRRTRSRAHTRRLSTPMRWLFLLSVASRPQRCFASRCALISSSATPWDKHRSTAEVFGCGKRHLSMSGKRSGLSISLILSPREAQWAVAATSAIWVARAFYIRSVRPWCIAIEDRSSRRGNRETIVMNYDEIVAEAKRLEERRKGLRTHRSAGDR